MDSASFSYLQLLMDIDTPRGSHYTRQLQTNSGYYSSRLKSPGHRNPTNKNKWEQQNTDSYFSYLEMVMDINTPRWNHDTRQLKTNGGFYSSISKSSGHRKPKTEKSETNPRKIPSLLDVVIPMPHNVSPNLSSCKRQFKQKQRKCHSVSSKNEKENKKTVVSKLNTGKTLLCDPETPSSSADRLTHNPAAKELKLIHTDVSVQVTQDTTCTAVSQLKDRRTSEDRSTLGTATDQRITLCSGTVTHEQSALSKQERQAFSIADTLLNDGNVPEQFALMSIEESFGVNNDHTGNVNTDMVPESHPLQQSQMLNGLAPRKSRMARFLGPIPFRQSVSIFDTNNHSDNTINNSSSFRQCGDLQHDTHNDGSLPDSRRVSESIDGPLTPEPYSSKDDTFVWTWPPAPVPKSQRDEETREDNFGTLLDPLPQLEMTLSEFVKMIEGTYKEPVIVGIEEYVQQRVPYRSILIPTDCYWVSQTTDQITRPCCKTESLLMDVTRELVESSKFRQRTDCLLGI